MITGEKILFFGGTDWWYHNPSSGIQLLQEMVGHGNEALYVNSIPLRMPKPGKSGSKNRYLNKLKSYMRPLKKAQEGIWVLTPVTLPGFGNSAVAKFNKIILKLQINVAKALIGWRDASPVVISMTPAAGLVLGSMQRKVAIYYLCDKFDAFRDIVGNSAVADLDRKVVDESDVLICVSRAIQKAYVGTHKKVYYVPHGVNFGIFNTAMTASLDTPPDLIGLAKPIIGYFGSITESNDKEILEYMCVHRPNWNIVMIGQVISDYSSLDKYPNIYFLGKKKLQDLPAYGRCFDVCIMNWIMNEWMSYCSPVKAKEYLAMGKPVVSVPIPEVVSTLSDVVSIAATPEEFVRKVEYELETDSPAKIARRVEKVEGDTWSVRSGEILGIIETELRSA